MHVVSSRLTMHVVSSRPTMYVVSSRPTMHVVSSRPTMHVVSFRLWCLFVFYISQELDVIKSVSLVNQIPRVIR